MKINRDNYQMWITDHYDGSLTVDQESQLSAFLNENRDLKEEFDLYGHPVIFPDITPITDKKSLRRDVGQLSEDQLEYLLVAMSEGDLQKDDIEDLEAYISVTPELQEKLYTLEKLKLTPPDLNYPNKGRLKRIPIGMSTRRVLINSLSAAAAIAVIISFWFTFRNNPLPEGTVSSVAVITPTYSDTSPAESIITTTEEESAKEINREVKTNLPLESGVITAQPENPEVGHSDFSGDISRESIVIPQAHGTEIVVLDLPGLSGTLAQMVPAEIIETPEASSPREFIAKNIREIFLKQEEGSVERLKGYEVADVTLLGVNKVLGWEMKLEKEKDSDGNINNLKFTSQMIKFDHKLKTNVDEL
jgi:hypothetical protein